MHAAEAAALIAGSIAAHEAMGHSNQRARERRAASAARHQYISASVRHMQGLGPPGPPSPPGMSASWGR